MLQGIRIQNYRIFSDDRAGILQKDLWEETPDSSLSRSAGLSPSIPMSNLMALIGRNASGKSLFFDALSFVADCTSQGCAAASTMHGRQGFAKLLNHPGQPMSFEFLFLMQSRKDTNPTGQNGTEGIYVSYSFHLDSDSHGRPFYVMEKVAVIHKNAEDTWDTTSCLDLRDGKGTVLSGKDQVPGGVSDKKVSALRSYGAILSFPILTALLKEISHWFFCSFSVDKNGSKGSVAPGGQKHLNNDGSNVQNVLDYMRIENPSVYKSVMDRIADRIPNVKKVSSALPDSFRSSPDKLFLYLLLLDDPMPRPLICVETPDMGLYHDMVDVLASEFRNYSIRHAFSQIIFTTHNPYILESMAPHEVWIFKRNDSDEVDQVNITCAGANPVVSEMYDQGVGMGAIWYSGHFDG